jgi:acyl-CoA thioesterase-1
MRRFLSGLLLSLLMTSSHAAISQTRILFLGDSLTEGYGVAKDEAYPALVEKALHQEGYAVQAINAGISGSTTSSGLSRLRWHLKAKPDILVLALGANDGLRGVPVASIRKNLSDVLALAAEQKIPVLFIGMKAPPNYGAAYTRAFDALFQELARQYHAAFLPFLLDRIAGESRLNQADGLHPNADGHRLMAQAVAKALKPLLAKAS